MLRNAWFVILSCLLCSAALATEKRDVGVKMLKPPAAPLAPVVQQLREAGITTVFCRTDDLFTKTGAGRNLREFRKLLAAAGIGFFITAPVFLDPEAIERDPSLAGIGHLGNPSKAPGLGWYGFVCPARVDYRKQRIAAIVDQVRELRPDGLSLDFIRYFVHWEKVRPGQPAESIEKFCFCDYCLGLMRTELGFEFPADAGTRLAKAAWVLANRREEWAAWKCEKITSMVRDSTAAARAAVPGIRISLHGVPWLDQEYDSGRRIVAGQDLKKLAPYIDVFGPMCYFQMLGRPPEWVHEVALDYFRNTGKPPLPSIQASGSDGKDIARDLFRRHLLAGFEPPSSGVNLFSWERLSTDADKRDVLREVLREQ